MKIPAESPRRGVVRRAFGNDDAMLVMNELTPGMALNPHIHVDFDQIAYIVSGEALYHVGDEAFPVSNGSLLLIPAGQPHYIEPTGSGPVLNVDVFAPAREDLRHLLEWLEPEAGEDR